MFKVLALTLLLLTLNVEGVSANGLPKEEVEKVSRLAHSLMAGAKVKNGGEVLGEEEAKKLVYPLIPYANREEVIIRGSITGMAAACGLDWQARSYAPYMARVRQKNPTWTGAQFAYVGLLHGISMGAAEKATKQANRCNEQTIQNLQPLLKKK